MTGRKTAFRSMRATPPRRAPSAADRAPARAAAFQRGSATVELVCLAPFVLALLAAVWDLREAVALRTELVREMYVVAQAITDDKNGTDTLNQALGKLRARLEPNSASGSIRAAVIVRDDRDPCLLGTDLCWPKTGAVWPPAADITPGTWTDGGTGCDTAGDSPLPRASGEYYGAGEWVLPGEPAVPEADWVSRNLEDEEWWIALSVCFEPGPGLFLGRLVNLPVQLLDTSAVVRRRIAWRSIHNLADCGWC